jgi:hypothetical protein
MARTASLRVDKKGGSLEAEAWGILPFQQFPKHTVHWSEHHINNAALHSVRCVHNCFDTHRSLSPCSTSLCLRLCGCTCVNRPVYTRLVGLMCLRDAKRRHRGSVVLSQCFFTCGYVGMELPGKPKVSRSEMHSCLKLVPCSLEGGLGQWVRSE